ncbi:hypothetical protein FISHEDRAFT_77243 [Fistulina hepatica ATCC 64428]|uniref:Uncharacterized protein n=1 Tax=Fistulina hepatica ATCC 64428 TaxID=1128425 RepID=A0A0D7A1F2_9AGAR|nr:hypothetical protein FISHEDRAFT_77243 [Fistulina hepatica ATCC 64428]
MFFAPLFAPLFAAFTAVGFVSAAPAKNEIQSRSDLDILNALTTLQTTTVPLLAELDSLAALSTATDDTVTPITDQILAALTAATDTVDAISSDDRRRAVKSRQTDGDIATLLATIIEDILDALDSLLPFADSITTLDTINSGLDGQTNTLIGAIDVLVDDLLTALAQLLNDVANIIVTLAWDLTGATLGFTD